MISIVIIIISSSIIIIILGSFIDVTSIILTIIMFILVLIGLIGCILLNFVSSLRCCAAC